MFSGCYRNLLECTFIAPGSLRGTINLVKRNRRALFRNVTFKYWHAKSVNATKCESICKGFDLKMAANCTWTVVEDMVETLWKQIRKACYWKSKHRQLPANATPVTKSYLPFGILEVEIGFKIGWARWYYEWCSTMRERDLDDFRSKLGIKKGKQERYHHRVESECFCGKRVFAKPVCSLSTYFAFSRKLFYVLTYIFCHLCGAVAIAVLISGRM